MTAERLALLAHELRSPVAALDALAARASSGDLPAGVLRRLLELAAAAARDVERLLTDPDLLSVDVSETDLGGVLAGLAGPRVRLAVEPVRVVCDPTRLRQAVGNLVANGLRHGQAVTVAARRDGGRVVIDVSDDGPGPPAGLDPFARGSSGAGSTGYGLWLARAIAERHGGALDLLAAGTAPGTTFRLVLPSSSTGRG